MDKSVLAVQSHVVHGYVGNKAATFPLQLRGWDVDALNVVQFSNHTGYDQIRGYKLDNDQISDIYAGLRAQNFHYDALLTGYLPSASVVMAVGRIGADIRERNPDCVWLVDPVMGDNGKIYVNEDVVPAYRSILKSQGIVTIITPNHFEVELLTRIKLTTKQNVLDALKILHEEFGIPHVVISSLPHPSDPQKLLTIGSSAHQEGTGHDLKMVPGQAFVIEQNLIGSYFTGAGDLFAALLLDNYFRLGSDRLADSTVQAVSSLRKVLNKTYEFSQTHYKDKARMHNHNMLHHELRIIQNAHLLRPCDDQPSYESQEVSWEPYT